MKGYLFPRFFVLYMWGLCKMEKLPGILENAISKIEDISCPPDDKDNNQHSSSSSIARAEANWRWADTIYFKFEKRGVALSYLAH